LYQIFGEGYDMAHAKVSLYWLCKTEEGWKRYPAAMGRNGKIRPSYAQVGSSQIYYAEGHYELRKYEDGKRVWKNLGTDPTFALAEQRQEAKRTAAAIAAAEAGTQLLEVPGRVDLAKKSYEFHDRQIARGKMRAAETFKIAVGEFMRSVRVKYADQLDESKINRWYAELRQKGNEDRTIYNKHVSVFGFLSWCGVETKPLALRPPDYTEKRVEVYQTEELRVFFESLSDPYHILVFELLLKTGLRMQEAMYLRWSNFDFERGTLTVKKQKDSATAQDNDHFPSPKTRRSRQFQIKDKAERTLPLPADLAAHLKDWRKMHTCRLVLGTKNDTPNWKWLPLLKRLARQAGLNCGACKSCSAPHEECERWYLHKFRATYTTFLLRAGIDVRTVMEYTGHDDLATVLRYVSAAETKDTQSKINSISWVA
jgi:integrase